MTNVRHGFTNYDGLLAELSEVCLAIFMGGNCYCDVDEEGALCFLGEVAHPTVKLTAREVAPSVYDD